MKRVNYLIILSQFFLLSFFNNLQAQQVKQITNVTNHGGDRNEILDFSFKLNNGNIIVTGFTQSQYLDDSLPTFEEEEETANGATFIYCLNANGEKLWHRIAGGSSFDGFIGYLLEEDGFILYGSSQSSDRELNSNKGGQDAWLVKYSNNGALLWSKSFGSVEDDIFLNVKKFNDTSYNAIIEVGSISDDFMNIAGLKIGKNIVKLDTGFKIVNVIQNFGSNDSLWSTDVFIAKDYDVIYGYMNIGSASYYGHSYLEKYDSNGSKLFDYTFKDDIKPNDSLLTYQYAITNILSVNDTTYFVIEKDVLDFIGSDMFYKGATVVIGLTPQGIEFSRYQTPNFNLVLNNSFEQIASGFVLSGEYLNLYDTSWSSVNGNSKGYLIFLDKSLKETYHYSLVGNGDNSFYGIYFNASNSSYEAVCQSKSTDLLPGMDVKGGGDLVWVNFDAFATSLKSATANSLDFNLFPNPNNGSFEIAVANSSDLPQFTVYDLNGRILKNGAGGKVSLVDFTSGIYIIQVNSNDKVGYKRFQVK